MTEIELAHAIALERIYGHNHVANLIHDWRRELWPNPNTDPIARADRQARLRREMAADAYWGPIGRGRLTYGGICLG